MSQNIHFTQRDLDVLLIKTRLDELKQLKQERIAASSPDRNSFSIISEWVAGSQVNNRIAELTLQLKDDQ